MTLFIPEFDLDLKMEKVFQKVMRKILFVFMQKRKLQNFVSFKTIFKQLELKKMEEQIFKMDILKSQSLLLKYTLKFK